MKKFEYLDDMAYADVLDSSSSFEEYLNNMGNEGWELVAMIMVKESLDSVYKHRLVWKRELEQ